MEQDRKSQLSRRSNKKSNMDTNRASQKELEGISKLDLPDSCYLSMMKKVLIEKLTAKFFLAVHPFPRIEGEMLIFKPKKEDQNKGKDVIVYRDYSLRKRIETTPLAIKEQIAMKKKQEKMKKKGNDDDEKEKEPEPFMDCLEVDITEPLNKYEWINFCKVIEETQGLGWLQILPVGQKSSQPYQFNVLHVLPSDKIPVKTLPIDTFFAG